MKRRHKNENTQQNITNKSAAHTRANVLNPSKKQKWHSNKFIVFFWGGVEHICLQKRLIRLFLAVFLLVLNPSNGKIKSKKNIDASEQSLTTYIY